MSDTLPAPAPPAYAELLRLAREAAVLQSATSLVSWDQETQMPPRGAPLRAEQMAMLSALVHERRTSPRLGELLAECEVDPALADDPLATANLRELRRDYDRFTRLPPDLVREAAEVSSLAMNVWREARERNDYAAFAPWLEKIVVLSRRTADALG